ncbi:MAG: GDP-mannose 4,6-dehydratase [Candidatus Paceibacterota bacterium]
MTNNILITGGTGFAGSHLVEALLAGNQTPETIHVTTFSAKPSFVSGLLPATNIHTIDLTQAEAVAQLLIKLQPIQIYHLASFSSPSLSLENTTKAIETNVEIQMNMLEAMRAHTPTARLLSIGSASEYAGSIEPLTETSVLGPHDPYGVSKVAQDMLAYSYAVRFELDIVRVRPFNHIGERQEKGFVVSDFAHQIVQIERKLQEGILVGNLEVTRDFSDVKDIVQAYILLMAEGQSREVYNIGSGQDVTIQELLEKLKALSTVDFSIKVEERKQRPGDIQRSVADIAKINKLGWQPTIPLENTLERILNWWRQQ